MSIPGYDAWKLSPPESADGVGTDDGQFCNRIPEPDEDAPRGYRPKPCHGVMVDDEGDGVICDTCGALA